MAEQYANSAVTTLASLCTSGATTISVSDASAFPTGGNFRVRIDLEILLVTGVSGTTFTVTRAAESVGGIQVSSAHASGAVVELVLTVAALLALPLDAGNIVSGQLALARGGTHTDMSATGGTKQYVKQLTVGGNFTISVIAAADMPVFVASGGSHAPGAVPDPGSSSGTTKFLREDATWQVPSSGGMVIGAAVTGGTAHEILFVDGSGNLGQSSAFTYDAAGEVIVTVGFYTAKLIYVAGATAGHFDYNNQYQAYLGLNSSAGFFTDGTNIAIFCDGSRAINITVGSIMTLGTSGNTYKWNAGTTAPSNSAGAAFTNYYGTSSGLALADPDAWVMINIGGTNYKVPAYI